MGVSRVLFMKEDKINSNNQIFFVSGKIIVGTVRLQIQKKKKRSLFTFF